MSRGLAAAAVAISIALGAGSIEAGSVHQPGVQVQDPYLSVAERARLQAEVAELERRVEAIRDGWRRAEEAESRRLDRLAVDRVTRVVGAVELRTAPAMADRVEAGVRATLEEFGSLLDGFELAPTLRLDVYDQETLGGRRAPDASTDGESDWRLVRTRSIGVAWDLRRDVHPWVVDAIPGTLGVWSAGRGWNPTPDDDVGLRALTQSRDPDGIACLQVGDLDACARFFILEYDGTFEWRRAALERVYPAALQIPPDEVARSFPHVAGLFSCSENLLRRGSADPWGECLTTFSEREAVALSLFPGGAAARSTLLAHAVRLAPPGGFRRLEALPAGSTIGEQLEALAEMPIRQLMTSWREDASLGRGLFAADDGDRPGPVSLFWAGGLAMLALRSTRWRLG